MDLNQPVYVGETPGPEIMAGETCEIGVDRPQDCWSKSGDPVVKVLWVNHPEARLVSVAWLYSYMIPPPQLFPLEIAGDTTTEVIWRLSGGSVPGGSDAVSLQHWRLIFGESSAWLYHNVSSLSEWLMNDFPPCAAYQALMAGRLIGLDKQSVVQPVRIGNTWRSCFAKCILEVSVPR